ncbi:MAG: hypothetical protein KJ058_16455 [Thermoanaerobaculia bacterium]|nr:hypothetical protein [Thermoanaerobaculia bacterium]MCZ7649680.1 outer membrane beta-barrel protein [Thermoanaerobaculia bacterium]
MARKTAPLLLALLAALSLAGEASARNLESYLFTAGVLGGRGGSFDLEPDPGLSNPAWSAFAGMATDLQTQVSVRLGRLEFDEEAGFGDLEKADLEYAVLAGEYRFPKSWYDVGVYLGLGGYRVDGRTAAGESVDDSGLGIAFGVTGDYRLWRNLFLTAEINAHYAFIDRASLFGTALAGLSIRF